ncbi:MAG: Gfo/Idh/MocA family protein, partial [bacterium]
AHLMGIASRNESTAKKFAMDYQIQHAYGNYQAMYNDPNIDAIYIATPHSCHLEQASAAMAAGKAVLCEKPININSAETEQLIDVANREDAYLMEGMWTHFLPAIRRAIQWIEDGRIGELRHIKADFGYPIAYREKLREYDAKLGGGCLLEMGVYPVFLAWLLTGVSPDSIYATGRTAPNGVEDDLVTVFNYPTYTATLGTSFRAKLQNWAYVIGSEGYIAIPDFWRATECHLYRLDERIDSFKDKRKGSGFEFQIQEVSDDILAGRKQSGVVPLASSLAVQRLMEQVKGQVVGKEREPRAVRSESAMMAS